MLKERINADLKSAMLARNRERVDVLRGLKSAILYEEVAQEQRDLGLSDENIEKVIVRECKKRDEAAALYDQGGKAEAAAKERAEKEVLSEYLPRQLSDDELDAVVQEAMGDFEQGAHMGKLIGAVKQKIGSQADGARIAAAVQKALGN